MRFTYLAAMAAIVSTVAGCSSIGAQFTVAAEPESGDRARIRVVNAAQAFIRAVPERSCLDWAAPGAGTVIGGMMGSSGYKNRSLQMPATENSQAFVTAEMYAAANKPFSVALLTGPDSRVSCSVATTFVPEKDKDYEVFFGMDHKVCVVNVRSLTEPGTKVAFREPEKTCQ